MIIFLRCQLQITYFDAEYRKDPHFLYMTTFRTTKKVFVHLRFLATLNWLIYQSLQITLCKHKIFFATTINVFLDRPDYDRKKRMDVKFLETLLYSVHAIL